MAEREREREEDELAAVRVFISGRKWNAARKTVYRKLDHQRSGLSSHTSDLEFVPDFPI